MTRGLETLFYKRQLLNPFRYGWFAWMLFSHKFVRWMVPWALLVAATALTALATVEPWARWTLGVAAAGCVVGTLGWLRPRMSQATSLFSLPTYILAGLIAGLHAWINALRGELNPIWEPTRRDAMSPK